MRFSLLCSASLLATLLCGCATHYDPDQPVVFVPGEAVPIEIAGPHLQQVVGKRITVSGLPRQREGSCRGAQPISSHDWMLTGETQCLWINGRAPGANLMDVRTGLGKDAVEVTGQLVISDQNTYVLKADRDQPGHRATRQAPPAPTPENAAPPVEPAEAAPQP